MRVERGPWTDLGDGEEGRTVTTTRAATDPAVDPQTRFYALCVMGVSEVREIAVERRLKAASS